MKAENLGRLYGYRFSVTERLGRDRLWQVLCEHYFQQFVARTDTVLDVACGQGEFIRHIRCAQKIAVDLNDEVETRLPPEVRFICARADALSEIPSGTVDTCFISNFFEHLEDKRAMDAVLQEVRRVLKMGGRLINMQPNIRYEPGRYWDFYDHVLPLSHLSAAEAFALNGYTVETMIPRFVPFTSKSAFPQHPLLVRAYLALPFVWRFLGGQFVIVARSGT